MKWKIKYAKSKLLKTDIKNLRKNQQIAEIIKLTLNLFSINPLDKKFNLKKLQPKSNDRYRLKIEKWRVIFSLDFGNKIILIYRVAQRKNVYKKNL